MFLETSCDLSTKSIEEESRAVLFRDDCSQYSCIHVLESKKQVVDAFERFLLDVKMDGTIAMIRSDNGQKYMTRTVPRESLLLFTVRDSMDL